MAFFPFSAEQTPFPPPHFIDNFTGLIYRIFTIFTYSIAYAYFLE
jgi:hypothetical protein